MQYSIDPSGNDQPRWENRDPWNMPKDASGRLGAAASPPLLSVRTVRRALFAEFVVCLCIISYFFLKWYSFFLYAACAFRQTHDLLLSYLCITYAEERGDDIGKYSFLDS